MMKLKILIAEPSLIITEGLRCILHDDPRLEILGTADDMPLLQERLAAHHPDIVIINPGLLPYAAQSPANAELPEGTFSVAIVYQYFEPAYLRNFDAVIDIRDSKHNIIATLTELDHETSNKHDSQPDAQELTKRERDILVLVAKGLMSKEIADQLNISIHTVISHRKNITKKTGIKSVAGLAVYAMLNNLMNDPTTPETPHGGNVV